MNFTDELRHDTGVGPIARAVKTPTLWGVGQTGPYFHDGSRATLRDVIAFYDAGFSTRQDVDPELRALGLSPEEKSDLEQYLLFLSAGLVQ